MGTTKPQPFTLIEMLVVISIISILGAMLSPALVKARQSAMGAVCRGNLRQAGMIMNMYCDSFNEYYPLASASGGIRTWSLQLLDCELVKPHSQNPEKNSEVQIPYNGKGDMPEGIWACPVVGPKINDAWNQMGHYAMNSVFKLPDEGKKYIRRAAFPRIRISTKTVYRSASEFILLSDNDARDGVSAWNPYYLCAFLNATNSLDDPASTKQTIGYRHLRQATILYCDGRVGSYAYMGIPLPLKMWATYD